MGVKLAWRVGLLGIVALSAYLRFHNLATNPGWDADEGYNINIAWNLAHGRFQMYSMSYAFVQHPPLFYAVLVPVFGALGANIFALRLLASLYGVLTTAVLFFVAKDVAGVRVALLSSALYAIYPVAVVFNRLGYTYNQLMFLGIVCFYCVWHSIVARERRRFWVIGAGLAAGLGSVTDQEGVFLILIVIIATALVERKRLALATATSLFPSLLYMGTMLAMVPAEFAYDLQHNFDRVSGGGPLIEGLIMAFNYEQFLAFSYWLPMGTLGLFLLRDRRAKLTTVGFFFLMLIFILKIRNPNPFFRTAVPVLPFVALGMGLLVDAAVSHLFTWGKEVWEQAFGPRWPHARSLAMSLATFALLFLPIAVTSATDIVGAQTRLRSGIDGVLANSPDAATKVSGFINERARAHDVVVASASLSWLIKQPTADLLQAVAADGDETAFYPAGLPKNRFVYDPTAKTARFVVLDDFTRLWAREMPRERAIVDAITASWTKVFESGEYQVFENPEAI